MLLGCSEVHEALSPSWLGSSCVHVEARRRHQSPPEGSKKWFKCGFSVDGGGGSSPGSRLGWAGELNPPALSSRNRNNVTILYFSVMQILC